MKRFVLLFLLISCLLCFCKQIDLYTGVLICVDYTVSEGFGRTESWTLRFEDSQVYTIHAQPLSGFKIGETYNIYRNRDKYLRARLVENK